LLVTSLGLAGAAGFAGAGVSTTVFDAGSGGGVASAGFAASSGAFVSGAVAESSGASTASVFSVGAGVEHAVSRAEAQIAARISVDLFIATPRLKNSPQNR
jgi:hypothetical protein